jgi:hypothetical protein
MKLRLDQDRCAQVMGKTLARPCDFAVNARTLEQACNLPYSHQRKTMQLIRWKTRNMYVFIPS